MKKNKLEKLDYMVGDTVIVKTDTEEHTGVLIDNKYGFFSVNDFSFHFDDVHHITNKRKDINTITL